MRSLPLDGVRSVVAIGAHPDDIEIGAGGLLLGLPPGVRVRYVTCTGTPDRHAEARAAAAAFLPTADVSFDLHCLPDGRLPAYWAETKAIVEAAARAGDADLVLAPARTDQHQDHRLLGDLVPTAFRDTVIMHFEIPKWDGDLTSRQVYVPMTVETARRKAALLSQCFPSQTSRDWWDDEVFLGLARLRGMECRSRYAEAFDVDRLMLRLGTAG
ncbi:PIG-L family deacetylase [Plantactinospora sp. S1510]|uniref:PIG-L family deacetylase n=1 Tax=Plantactinospora alkalitolerans TaxID=2789879 RepID=A0ABS0H2W5_9ACTN|nr:PIG-L family deacetylase [Plantactinospora alkalitolerans]MBF9132801.1 PIG-L family deacetylase [Plantactinospora alkalitolerans]